MFFVKIRSRKLNIKSTKENLFSKYTIPFAMKSRILVNLSTNFINIINFILNKINVTET